MTTEKDVISTIELLKESAQVNSASNDSTVGSKYSDNFLQLIQELQLLKKNRTYISSAHTRSDDRERGQGEAIYLIEDGAPHPYVKYLQEAYGHSFLLLRDKTVTFTVYIERHTIRTYENSYSCYAPEKPRDEFAQYVIVDLMNIPDTTGLNETTVYHKYRDQISKDIYRQKLGSFYKDRGIIYIAEFNVSTIKNKICTLMENNWIE